MLPVVSIVQHARHEEIHVLLKGSLKHVEILYQACVVIEGGAHIFGIAAHIDNCMKIYNFCEKSKKSIICCDHKSQMKPIDSDLWPHPVDWEAGTRTAGES